MLFNKTPKLQFVDFGRLVGVVVKAVATVKQSAFRGLRKLSQLAGDQFKMGVLLCNCD